MLLAFDTSTAACTAALFDGSGACVAHADEVIGRGHAERLVPMIAELMDGLAASSRLPRLDLDVSDDDVPRAADRVGAWLGETGGLHRG